VGDCCSSHWSTPGYKKIKKCPVCGSRSVGSLDICAALRLDIDNALCKAKRLNNYLPRPVASHKLTQEVRLRDPRA